VLFSVRPIWALSTITIIEAVRDRLFSVLAFFGGGLVLLAVVLSQLSLGWPARIVADLAFASISVVGTVAAAALTVRFVGSDFQRRTLYPILARPNRRAVYLIGRYLGVVGAIALLTFGMWAMSSLSIALATRSGGPQIELWESALYCAFAILRFAVVSAAALLLITVASPTLAFVGALSLAVAAHASSDVHRLLEQSESEGARLVAKVIQGLIPDFTALNPLSAIVHDGSPWSISTAAAVAYGILYVALLLVGALWAFDKRDIA